MNEALHLRAMQAEDPSLPFYQKTQNLREMHKNRQNSVDSISDIRLDVGMDAREMKKQILFVALDNYFQKSKKRGIMIGSAKLLSKILDKDPRFVTKAEIVRFRQVLITMRDDAESKI